MAWMMLCLEICGTEEGGLPRWGAGLGRTAVNVTRLPGAHTVLTKASGPSVGVNLTGTLPWNQC